MRRRDFIKVLTGSAAAWPVAARAQQPERIRRIGVLMNRPADDSEGQAGVAAFKQTLQQLGWNDGGNVRIDIGWGADDVEQERKYAAQLLALAPDVILASGTLSLVAVQRINRSLPIVFVLVSDPIAGGFVDSLAHPGGNVTGFMNFEYSLIGKWPELLKQIAPNVRRVAVVKNLAFQVDSSEFGAIQAVAPSLGLEVNAINVRNADQIESAVAAFARTASGGLIVTSGISASVHRRLIIALAARYNLPAIYANRASVTGGGLMTYGPDRVDQFRRAASYVDRILKGEKPTDLPVQAPTKYKLVINLKTAKALGLTVPPDLLATADEVIQ